jgi:hypothetical protein
VIGYHIAIVLRGFWCSIIVLIVHAATENNSEEPIDSYYEELQQVFDYFATFGVKILLQKLNAQLGRENAFKTTNESENLNVNSISSDAGIVKFAISKNQIPEIKMFLVETFVRYTRTAHARKPDNLDWIYFANLSSFSIIGQ